MRALILFVAVVLVGGCIDLEVVTGETSSTETSGGGISTSTATSTSGLDTGSSTGVDGASSSSGDAGFCGDGIANGDDACDGDDLGGETCETQGFESGTLVCLPDCTGFDTDLCGFCPSQPLEGPLSVCEVPMEGPGYCPGGELCLGESGGVGFCSSECSGDVECAVPGLASCEAIPNCVMGQCAYECGANFQCPNPMTCVLSEALSAAICA